MTDREREEDLNARARLEEWLLPEDSVPLRKDVGVALRFDPEAKSASRSAAAKYGTGGVVEAMVLAGFLEKEGELVYERGEISGEDDEAVARRLTVPPGGLREGTGMGDSQERAACRVLAGVGVLEIRDADAGRIYASRDRAPDDGPLVYVLLLRPLEALVERVRDGRG